MTQQTKQKISQIQNGEIPTGYKQTKVGIVPCDWEIKQVFDILIKESNKVIINKKEYYQQIGIRSHGKGIFYKDLVTGEQLGNKSIFWLKPNCLIVNIVFAWEQAITRTTIKELGMVGSHRFPIYSSKNNKCDIDFLVFFFMTKRGKLLLDNASPGGAGRNKTLGQKEFSQSKVIAPPLHEQQKIAKILTTQDKLIELKEKLITEKQEQKQYLMQTLLTGKKRLDGFSGEWKILELNQVLKESKKLNEDQSLEICSVAVTKGVVNQIEHLGRSYAAKNTSKYNVVSFGDVVYTKSPTGNFPYGIVKQSKIKNDVAVSPLYGVFKPMSDGLGYMIHCYFESFINSNNYLKTLVQKGAKNTINISNQTFISGKLFLPIDIAEQNAISNILTTADNEINLLKQDLEQEKQKKKALMQLLLTGIVRV